ncbi:MAG: Ig-like domain-containing domain [Candidatus Aquicultor sp.]
METKSILSAPRLLILLVALWLALSLSPTVAHADQLVLNGDFKNDLSNWGSRELAKGIPMSFDSAGFENGGSLGFTISGRRSRGESSAKQRITIPIKAGSTGKIEFAWRKNWTTILPLEQRIYINLTKPDNTSVTVWANRQVLNDNTWVTDSVDISQYLNQTGGYHISVGAAFENGNAREAVTYAWFDSVKLDIAMGLSSAPQTSFLNPTGASKLTGSIYPISGVAVDDAGVTKVELAITRLYDKAWWNGTSWVKNECWNAAKVTSSAERSVTWIYPWPLPTSDGAHFKILGRSVDVTANKESIPIENDVAVDNVGPVGNIFIEDAATYTNSQKVRIDIDVQGAAEMRFSLDNGQTWTDWEKYAPTKTLILPKGDGMKIVNGQFKDDSDNSYVISDSITLDTVSPVTRHIFPAMNATKVLPGTGIGIVFYEHMDPLSIKNDGTEQGSTFYLKQGSRWISASASFDEKAKSAKLIPRDRLESGTAYTVYLTTGIKDAAKNPLAANFSWSFTTEGSYQSSFKQTVGPAGGVVTDNNQTVSLEVPASALSTETTIMLEELRGNDVPDVTGATRYSPVYRIDPLQLPLGSPATFRIKYKPDEIPDPTSLRLVSYDEKHKKWMPVQNTRIDLVNNQLVAPLPALVMVTVIAQSDPAGPSTAIIDPTGVNEIGGRTYAIYGLSTDNAGIARVEVSISRQSDKSYWNGTDWQTAETWLPAKTINGKGSPEASGRYLWILPEDRFTSYILRARAIDNAGNVESNPNIVGIKLTGN